MASDPCEPRVDGPATLAESTAAEPPVAVQLTDKSKSASSDEVPVVATPAASDEPGQVSDPAPGIEIPGPSRPTDKGSASHGPPKQPPKERPREVRRGRRPKPVFQIPTLRHFHSSLRLPQILENLAAKSLAENRQLDHVLLHGLPGCGSALVAQALSREIVPKRCVEFDALDGCSPAYLTRAIDRARGGGVLLIRHIEVLDAACDAVLAEALGAGELSAGRRLRRKDSVAEPSDTFEQKIARSARRGCSDEGRKNKARRCDFTLIGTAHYIGRVGYRVRTRFDHMIHLRKDPRGLRAAVVAASLRRGVSVGQDAFTLLEQFLRTTDDCAEQLVHAIVARAEIEGVSAIDAALAASILTEDLPCRISDEAYAGSLTRHLGGRRIPEATDQEVARLVSETGWSEDTVRGALLLIIHDERRNRSSQAA